MNASPHRQALADQITVAAAQIHAGLDLLGLATRTPATADHLAVLHALSTPNRSDERGVVQHLAQVLDTIAVSLDDHDDDQVAAAADYLREAQDRLVDAVGGDLVERAQVLLAEDFGDDLVAGPGDLS